MPAIALTNAELFEQTEARAAQLAVLQAASGRLSRATTVEAVGRALVEETRRIIDYHNARVYLVELPDQVVPDRVRGPGRRLRAGRLRAPALPARRGLHGLGRPARRAAAHQRREPRSRAARPSSGPTTSTNRCSSCRCATTASTVGVITLSKLGLDGFDVRRPAPARASSPTMRRRPSRSARLLTRSQDLARRAPPPARHERRAVREPRSAPGREPDGRPSRPRDGRRRMRHQLLGSRSLGRVDSLGYFPALRARGDGAVLRGRRTSPRPCACSRGGSRSSSTREDPAADPAEVALARSRRQPHPRHAPARRQGPGDRPRRDVLADGGPLGRAAGSSSPGRWPTRPRWRSRTPGCTRTPASAPTATR